jgi:hypothetical protein
MPKPAAPSQDAGVPEGLSATEVGKEIGEHAKHHHQAVQRHD